MPHLDMDGARDEDVRDDDVTTTVTISPPPPETDIETGDDTQTAPAGMDNDNDDAGNDTAAGVDHDNDDPQMGAPGNDDIAGDDNGDIHAGMTVAGTANDDFLVGGDGNDSLSGGDGNDLLIAAGGKDTLDGGAGDDTLVAHHGADVLTGGEGNDLFIVQSKVGSSEDGLTRITDFTSGQDKLMFQDEDMDRSVTNDTFGTGTANDFLSALADAKSQIAGGDRIVAEQVGNDVIVFEAGGEHGHQIHDAVVLVGKTLADIQASDII